MEETTTRVRASMDLDGTWELTDTGAGVEPSELSQALWRPCAVPGTVQQALHALGDIPHPLHGTNAERLRWIEQRTWWYRRTFALAPEALAGREVVLRCAGLDTFATVWCNGRLAGRHENQLTPFETDVTALLRAGENELLVRLDPVAASVHGRSTEGLWQEYDNLEALHARKCQASFGWDLAPRLVTAGVWRSVSLDLRAPLNIEDVRVRTAALADAEATVQVDVELAGEQPAEGATLELALRLEGADEVVAEATLPVAGTERLANGALTARLAIADPRLWWPLELGEQDRYRCVATLRTPDAVLDERETAFGIRDVQLVQEADSHGRGFVFEVNGVLVFCKGSNWVPVDAITLRGEPERYRELLELARDAGINMMRVWGGGIYEEPAFYEACDELGILVWQDFMYGCAVYPHDEEAFARAAEHEARVAVRALRNHPSVVIWCGNNECQWLHACHRHEDPSLPERMPGLDFFERRLAEVCSELDGTRPYVPTSPWGGEHPNSIEHGDRHAYRVGFGELDDADYTMDNRWAVVGPQAYRRERPRFVSEFAAIPGLPEPEAIARYLTPDERVSVSEAWRFHMPMWPGSIDFQAYLEFYCASLFGVPSDRVVDHETWERYARLVQGEFLELGLREFRRQWPHCGGALFWQFNSMWPSMDWGVLDYDGHPKPGYYYVKRALAPVVALLRPGCDAALLAEGRDATPVRWALETARFDGTRRVVREGEALLAPRLVTPLDAGAPPAHDYACLSVAVGGEVVSRDVSFATDPRVAGMPLATLSAELVAQEGERVRVRVETDAFAWAVRLGAYGARCSDNYFHLEAGGVREIEVDLARAEQRRIELSALNVAEPVELVADAESLAGARA
jgi:beta-mannosidase